MVAQLDILETMTPLEFLSFRDRLESGSGFQSYQFRELEFALGWKEPKALDRYPVGSEARQPPGAAARGRLAVGHLPRSSRGQRLRGPRADLDRDVTPPGRAVARRSSRS